MKLELEHVAVTGELLLGCVLQRHLTDFDLCCTFACFHACRMKPELEHIAVTSELLDASGQIKWHNYLNYFIFGKGPMATTGCDRGAFVNTRGTMLSESLRYA
jgi:hypothetical protein